MSRVNLQRVESRQALVLGIAPEEFGALAFRQFEMGVGQAIQNVRGAIAAEFFALPGDQPIAEAEQIVADVDRRANAILAMQRGTAVAEGVVIFDVVMHQRCLVKRLDRQRRAADAVGQLGRLGGPRGRRALRAS